MVAHALEGFAPIDRSAAVRLLATEAGLEPDEETATEIAAIVGCEPPALRWAAQLARTIGWRPLRPRLAGWSAFRGLLRESRLPWSEQVERAVASVPATAASVLEVLAACDARFSWDVLEAVAADASIETVCTLEDAGLLTRRDDAGVVTFCVPYGVRAAYRLTDADALATSAALWLGAWVRRAEVLRATTYGASSRATLAELAAAVALAAAALGDPDPSTRERGLALWTATSDATFFAGAIDLRSEAFSRAVTVADACGALEDRVRARLVAARALLECGDPTRAAAFADEARLLAEAADRDDLRSEALRGAGWSDMASARVDAARASFAAAQRLSEKASDPRGQADATAGLGMLSLLGGDAESARGLLAEALAIHVVMRDGPRAEALRAMMELVPASSHDAADLGRLAAEVDVLRARGQRWREAIALARLGLAARARGDAEGATTHLLQARAAAALSSMPASKLAGALIDARAGASAIVVGGEGRSLTLPDGESHDLTRHGPLRRVLWALARARIDRPGVALSTLEIVSAGWPDEKMKHEAATLRVYTTIRRLRGMGLSEALITRDDGYLLDPEVFVVLEA